MSANYKIITWDEWAEYVATNLCDEPEYQGEAGLMRALDEISPLDYGFTTGDIQNDIIKQFMNNAIIIMTKECDEILRIESERYKKGVK